MKRIKKKYILKTVAYGMILSLLSVNTVSAMRIQHNITALNSHRNLYDNLSGNLTKNLEKLSSGYRINRAGDDATGLAISEQMRAQIKGLETTQQTYTDSIFLIQTADGALTEIHSMLNRMIELAEQSANGEYVGPVNRAEMQKEIERLQVEINRIAVSANYNGMPLLDGSEVMKSDVNAQYLSEVQGNKLEGVNIQGKKVINESGEESFELLISGKTKDGEDYSEILKLENGNAGSEEYIFFAGDLETEGSAVFGISDGEDHINAVVITVDENNRLSVDNQMVLTDGKILANLSFGTTVVQTDETVDFVKDGKTLLMSYDRKSNNLDGFYGAVKEGNELLPMTAEVMQIVADGQIAENVEIALNEILQLEAHLIEGNSEIKKEVNSEGSGTMEESNGENSTDTFLKQIVKQMLIEEEKEAASANETVDVWDMRVETLGISGTSILDPDYAKTALRKYEEAAEQVAKCRASLGTAQNRLEHQINNLSVQEENMTLAESRIRDVDMAEEMMTYAKNNILLQASQSMVEQAKNVPQGVLELLQ